MNSKIEVNKTTISSPAKQQQQLQQFEQQKQQVEEDKMKRKISNASPTNTNQNGARHSSFDANALMAHLAMENGQGRNLDHIVYRLVLTGGPCSGKTTGQARLSTFFENLGWKVFRVPETASVLFGGGIRFPDMDKEEQDRFQENLIRVMISLERTFFQLAATCKQNCIVICDRGVMDASAYMEREAWEKVLKTYGWNPVEMRDNRYNQVIHLVTSADGAEEYYNCEDNPCRTEGLALARDIDKRTMQAWVGHPYMDVIDNTTDFDTKMRRLIKSVCRRIGIETDERLNEESRKVKYLVKELPPRSAFPPYQDFDVVHHYLSSINPKVQGRLRKRGQNGNWSYQHTVRRSDAGSQLVELRRQIKHRDYMLLLGQRDPNHQKICKTRRCFLWQQTYFQMDIYHQPKNSRCKDLVLLETYTTLSSEELASKLPPFLTITKEVSEDPAYSMYNLSKVLPHERKSSASSNPSLGFVPEINGSSVNGNGNHRNKVLANGNNNSKINGKVQHEMNGTNGKVQHEMNGTNGKVQHEMNGTNGKVQHEMNGTNGKVQYEMNGTNGTITNGHTKTTNGH